MRTKRFRGRDSGLQAASFVLRVHQLNQRRKIFVVGPRQLGAMTAQHLPFDLCLFRDIHVKPWSEAAHPDCIHPPQRWRRFHGLRPGLVPSRSAEPRGRGRQRGRRAMVRVIIFCRVG